MSASATTPRRPADPAPPQPPRDPAGGGSAETPLIRVGETLRGRLRYSVGQIVEFARLTGDANPLHHDRGAAERAHFGEIIASGQQTASHLMGLAASHFSRRDDGIPREMLCLGFEFTFRAPVFAEQEIALAWRVESVEPGGPRGGWVGRIAGSASVAGRDCVVAVGTVLVRRAATTT